MKKLLSLILLIAVSMPVSAQLLTTCYDINTGLVPEFTFVRVENLTITAVAAYGYYAQEDAGGPYAGMWVYTGSANPPTEIIGDIVNVEGEYYEYYGYSEIDMGSMGGDEYVGFGTVPDPEVVRAFQVKTSNPSEAEKWEAMLVQVLNLDPLPDDLGYGEWWGLEFGYAQNDTCRFDDQFTYGQPLPGQQMESATGTLRYGYDFFKIEPRGNYDLVFVGAEPAPNLDYAVATGMASVDVQFDREVDQITAENPWNYFLDAGLVSTAVLDPVDPTLVHLTLSADMPTELYMTLTVFDVQNTTGIPMSPQDVSFWGGINTIAFVNTPIDPEGNSMLNLQVVTFTGVIQAKLENRVYLTDLSGGTYSGIEVYCPAIIDDLEVGDIYIIGDFLNEYYGMTSITYPFYYSELVSTGNTPPAVPVIGISGVNMEEYECQLVTVDDVTVATFPTFDTYGEWFVDYPRGDSLKVGEDGEVSDYVYNPVIGDILDLTGVIRYTYDEYKLYPRDESDIVIVFDNPPTDVLPAGPAVMLGQNFPNPFNPSTKISFRIDREEQVRLEVLGADGRRVVVLQDGMMGEGEHSVVWNGQTADGAQAASGLYYYRIVTENETISKKMVLLK